MNFFKSQDAAHRATRWLLLVYTVSTALIVLGVTLIVGGVLYMMDDMSGYMSFTQYVNRFSGIMIGVAVVATLIILGGSAYKISALSSGGRAVAQSLGGTLVPPNVTDPLRQRLRNVVEEMAIASGTPVPDIYVLEQEEGINAFAAGYEPGDAAIAVTRGALELLDRDELQGVIGHEFSHVLNGDMRLNIRLMGVLFGIMMFYLIGSTILRAARHGDGRTAIVAVMLGGGLSVLGGIGMYASRLIKASVSRQREYLADASAVQFTRQTTGIANALKKIGGYTGKSYLTVANPEEVSHMLFGSGLKKLRGAFATHPPLTERIRALEPSFDPSDYPTIDYRTRQRAAAEATAVVDTDVTSAMAAGSRAPLTESIADMVGDPETEHVAYAAAIRQSVPAGLYEAAHSSEMAYLLVVALILDRSGRSLQKQLHLAIQQLGQQRADVIRRLYDELGATGAEYRLPLLGIAFPALKRRPPAQLEYLIELTGEMIEVDDEIDLYEYCFHRVLAANLKQAGGSARRRRRRSAERNSVRRAATTLLCVIARHGQDDDAARQRAFSAGMGMFGKWGKAFAYDTGRKYSTADLDKSLDILLALNGDGQKRLLEAVTAVVMSDKRLSIQEAELIRAICASLNCPLPPILVEETVS